MTKLQGIFLVANLFLLVGMLFVGFSLTSKVDSLNLDQGQKSLVSSAPSCFENRGGQSLDGVEKVIVESYKKLSGIDKLLKENIRFVHSEVKIKTELSEDEQREIESQLGVLSSDDELRYYLSNLTPIEHRYAHKLTLEKLGSMEAYQKMLFPDFPN